jgi:predicted phage tail protein
VIQRSTNGTTWTTLNDGSSTATTFTVTGLANGTAYQFRIAAVNAVGRGAWSTPVAATPRWKPAAPSGLRAVPASRKVTLTWTAPPTSGGSTITDYVIQRSANGKSWTTVRDGVSTTRSSVVGSLTNGTTYRFRVAAKNAVGTALWSAIVRATPRAG